MTVLFAMLMALLTAFAGPSADAKDSGASVLPPLPPTLAASPGRMSAAEVDSTIPKNVIYMDLKDAKRSRVVPIKIYMPSSAQPAPVVIFSHGLGGSREGADNLGAYWSAHGYVSVHVQHIGSDESVWKPMLTGEGGFGRQRGSQGMAQGFKPGEGLQRLKELRSGKSAQGLEAGRQALVQKMRSAINPKTFLDRNADIPFVIDQLTVLNQKDPKLKGRMDLSKIAMTGHSYGAGTTLAIAGQMFPMSQSFADKRVKAAIYLSPPVNLRGRDPADLYRNITVPGLLMTGTEDNSPIGETAAPQRRVPFDAIKAPHQYLVNFVGGDHMIFNGPPKRRAAKPDDRLFLENIERVTTAFLDAYLKGDPKAQAWLEKDAEAYLAPKAKYEHK